MKDSSQRPPELPSDPEFADPNFRPRKDFLVVVGILVILSGLVFLALAAGCAFGGPVLLDKMPKNAFESMQALPFDFMSVMKNVLLAYGVAIALPGIFQVWLGFGSVLAKRWAVKLLHATGWYLIGMGVMQAIGQLLMIPMSISLNESIESFGAGAATSPGLGSGGGMLVLEFVGAIVNAVGYLITFAGPGALLVVVYGRKNVELTCRYHDPSTSWTDAVNFRVLILWVLLFSWLPFVASVGSAVPALVETSLVANKGQAIVWLAVTAAIAVVLLFGVAKAKMWSWWGALALIILSTAIPAWWLKNMNLLVLLEQGLGAELFATMLESEESSVDEVKERISSVGTLIANYTIFSMAFVAVVYIGFLFYIRKHFGCSGDEMLASQES